jgi:hypothetical protein
VIVCVCLGSAIAILCTSHDTVLEQSPDPEATASLLVAVRTVRHPGE